MQFAEGEGVQQPFSVYSLKRNITNEIPAMLTAVFANIEHSVSPSVAEINFSILRNMIIFTATKLWTHQVSFRWFVIINSDPPVCPYINCY